MVPVIKEASAEASHKIALAISSGAPARCMGTDGATRAIRPGSPPFACISVLIIPGRTALTRMPSLMISFARPSVKVSMAPLVAA